MHTAQGIILGVLGRKPIHLMRGMIGRRRRRSATSGSTSARPSQAEAEALVRDRRPGHLRAGPADRCAATCWSSKSFDNRMGAYVAAEAARAVAGGPLEAAVFAVAPARRRSGCAVPQPAPADQAGCGDRHRCRLRPRPPRAGGEQKQHGVPPWARGRRSAGAPTSTPSSTTCWCARPRRRTSPTRSSPRRRLRHRRLGDPGGPPGDRHRGGQHLAPLHAHARGGAQHPRRGPDGGAGSGLHPPPAPRHQLYRGLSPQHTGMVRPGTVGSFWYVGRVIGLFSLRNAFRRKAIALLAIIGVGVGCALMTALLGLSGEAQARLDNTLTQVAGNMTITEHNRGGGAFVPSFGTAARRLRRSHRRTAARPLRGGHRHRLPAALHRPGPRRQPRYPDRHRSRPTIGTSAAPWLG